MGKGCKIHSGAVIAGVPQDLKFKGEYTTVEMGDYNTVRESATVNRGTAAKGKNGYRQPTISSWPVHT